MNDLIEYPYRVYIIELEQPWENWYGDLLTYYPDSNFCEVEDNKGEIQKVSCSHVFDADDISKNIKQFMI